MANQTNVIFNGGDSDVTVTLAAAPVVVPARGKTADVGVTGTDAEWVTIMALGNLFVCKASPNAKSKVWVANSLKTQD